MSNLDKVKIAGFPLKTRITMTPYAQLPTHRPEEYLRIVGLSQDDFLDLNRKLTDYPDEQKALKPSEIVNVVVGVPRRLSSWKLPAMLYQ